MAPLRMEFSALLAPVHFVRLKLTRGDALVSENFYWRGVAEGDFRALRTLPKVQLDVDDEAPSARATGSSSPPSSGTRPTGRR